VTKCRVRRKTLRRGRQLIIRHNESVCVCVPFKRHTMCTDLSRKKGEVIWPARRLPLSRRRTKKNHTNLNNPIRLVRGQSCTGHYTRERERITKVRVPMSKEIRVESPRAQSSLLDTIYAICIRTKTFCKCALLAPADSARTQALIYMQRENSLLFIGFVRVTLFTWHLYNKCFEVV
jgi:hypothetical protein